MAISLGCRTPGARGRHERDRSLREWGQVKASAPERGLGDSVRGGKTVHQIDRGCHLPRRRAELEARSEPAAAQHGPNSDRRLEKDGALSLGAGGQGVGQNRDACRLPRPEAGAGDDADGVVGGGAKRKTGEPLSNVSRRPAGLGTRKTVSASVVVVRSAHGQRTTNANSRSIWPTAVTANHPKAQ